VNALTILSSFSALTLVKATPLLYAALGGVLCERAGVLNVALEGMLAVGAFAGAVIASATGSAVAGLVAGVLASALLGVVLAVAATRLRADQIVAGIGLNMLALGGTAFGVMIAFGHPGASPEAPALGQRGANALTVLVVALAFVLDRALACTPWGLRLRACGENPAALRCTGIDPRSVRFGAVVLGAAIVGLGGVYLSLGELNLYSEGMTGGRGFIALAAIIFGGWTPLGALGAALFFGAFSALQFMLQRSGIPSEFMQALPYVAALVALCGFAGSVRAPAADGVPYDE
jgi:general nucleoside transport system permease protein